MAEGRPSPKKNTGTGSGAGILIDTEHILSPDSKKSGNPYYVVHKGIRYYGSSPDDVISSFKDQVGRDDIDTGANAPRKRGLWSGMLKGKPNKCAFKRGSAVKVVLPEGTQMDEDHQNKNKQVGTVKSVFPDTGICERVTVIFKDRTELDYEVKYLRSYGVAGRVASGLGSAGRATRRGLGVAGRAAGRGLGVAGRAAGRGLGVAASGLKSGLNRGSQYARNKYATRQAKMSACHLRRGHGVRFRKDVNVNGIFPEATELQAKGSVGTVTDLHRRQDYSCPKVDVNFKRPGIITGIPSNLLEHVGRLGRFTQYVGRRHSKSIEESSDPYEKPATENNPSSTELVVRQGGSKTRRARI